MYAGDWAPHLSRLLRQARPSSVRQVPANVWGLGVTSLLTDISSEMVISVLPAYLVLTSGAAPLVLGIAAGLHDGGPVLVSWVGGWVADHSGRRKATAACGYVVSAVSRLGWLLVSGRAIAAVAMLILADRLGKAVRTAPRDALISLSARPDRLSTAFGVHRALDAAGAAIGPLTAWMILWHLPQRYDVVFFTSLVVGLLGVAAIGLLVHERPDWRSSPQDRQRVWAGALDIFTHRSLRRVLIVATALGLVTIRDAFLYLLLVRQSEAQAHELPLLYTGTALSFLVLAVPIGHLADVMGRARTFVLGHGCLLAACGILLGGFAPWPWNAVAVVLLLGAFYASSDGVLASLAGGLLPASARSLGLAWMATGVGVARLCSAVAFGALWTQYGERTAVTGFMGLLVIVMAVAWVAVRRVQEVAR